MNIDWIEFWVGCLATYRVTLLITRCLGPWEIFKKLRSIDRCSKLLRCPRCVSIYIGAVTAFGLWLAGYVAPWPLWIMIALGFSSVTIVIDRTFTADVTN